METLHSRMTTGEQSGGQEHSQQDSPLCGPEPQSPSRHCQPQEAGSQKPHGSVQQRKQLRRQNTERKRLRPQRQGADSDSATEGKHGISTTTKSTRVSSSSTGDAVSSAASSTQGKQETKEGTPKQKRERKPQRPGKYVCAYCGRACAKPSVLQKHIRSHTGERPYPCTPCGFSFKTKSNLYKHRKSHTHRVKAGLVFGESRSLEGHATESEDESKPLPSASSSMERQGSLPSLKSQQPPDKAKDHPSGMDESYAVKKRLAMRLSRGKHGPLDSPDEKTSSIIQGSRGSTESGYFSRSESTEQPQDSPTNTSAKSYAEIILGKYGRLGHLQRMSRHHNQQSLDQEEKNVPFTVPKKQVIDHITKLITINEAVVDTSKIDSVKPRRFSLSRKTSTESQKNLPVKEYVIHSPKAGDPVYKTSGSITMGVPCEKFHHQSLNVEPLSGETSAAPLLRSHSMPSSASSLDHSSSSAIFRPCQSFDEQTVSRRYGMLRRQPAIEIPFCGELTKEGYQSAHSVYLDNIPAVPDHKQSQPQPFECEACGTGCKDWEGYKIHKQSLCLAQCPVQIDTETAVSYVDRPQLINQTFRPGASAIRKRRKEESFESDDSSPVASSLPCPAFTVSSLHSRDEGNVESRPPLKTFSVIQHTSSFEKQDPLFTETHGKESAKHSPFYEEFHPGAQKPPQQHTTKPYFRKLVRQTNVQVPEILVTEDANITESISQPTFTSKPSEKPEEFQWPQRSPSLAQLPIEKLPPKKKRLRLAEAAQSSGESSFDSISWPRSPSQDSSASHASSLSASFEEPNRSDMETASLATPLRRSRAPHMLTVPGLHQHREMRRSASEQAPHEPQQGLLVAENRSKSFDYSCLSPERSAVGWRERRKCLLMRHSAVRDEEEVEEQEQSAKPVANSPSVSSRVGPSVLSSIRPNTSPLSGNSMSYSPVRPECKDLFSQRQGSHNAQLSGSIEPHLADIQSTVPFKERAAPVHTGAPDLSRSSPQHHPMQGPSGAARAHYLTVSTGLKLEIPPQRYSEHAGVKLSPAVHPLPSITRNPELMMPPTSPAIAVRLQADTPMPACAIYTTLSQTRTPSCQDPVVTSIPTFECRSHTIVSLDLPTGSESGLRSPTSTGSKRMLSPSNSIEFQPESQQQQKRVKEEDEARGQRSPSTEADKGEAHPPLPTVCPPVTHVGPPLTSLQSNTCNSWCYLNYTKPNPWTTDERQPSVYSSWSTSGHDPNPPGLSSKTTLSLLHCKQRPCPSIYTTCSMSRSTADPLEVDNSRRPCSTEVHTSQSCKQDPAVSRQQRWHAEDKRSDKAEEECRAEEAGEDVHSSKYRSRPHTWLREEGSRETCGSVRAPGEGENDNNCDCRFHCETSGASSERTCLHADSKDSCKHCKLLLPKHMRSTACEEQHLEAYDTDEGICEDCSMDPDEQAHRQLTGSQEGRHAADEDDSRSTAMASAQLRKQAEPSGHTGGPEAGPSHLHTLGPKDHRRARSASCARESLELPQAIGGSVPGCHVSPAKATSPRRGASPPGSPSPRPCHLQHSPPLSLSSAGCRGTSSPERGPPGSHAHPGEASSTREDPPLPGDGPAPATFHTSQRAPSVHGPAPLAPQPAPPRGAYRVLSHLPLHSQQPIRGPSLMIPIGGLYIIQPRATLYSFRSGPSPCSCPGDNGERSPQHLQVTGSPPGGHSTRGPSSPGIEAKPDTSAASTLYQGSEMVAHPETVQGQRQPPSQTQL